VNYRPQASESTLVDKVCYYLGVIKKLDKLLGKIDNFSRGSTGGDWESKLYDPEPLSVKFLLKALISYPLALLYIAIVVTAVYFLLLLLFS